MFVGVCGGGGGGEGYKFPKSTGIATAISVSEQKFDYSLINFSHKHDLKQFVNTL